MTCGAIWNPHYSWTSLSLPTNPFLNVPKRPGTSWCILKRLTLARPRNIPKWWRRTSEIFILKYRLSFAIFNILKRGWVVKFLGCKLLKWNHRQLNENPFMASFLRSYEIKLNSELFCWKILLVSEQELINKVCWMEINCKTGCFGWMLK